MFKLAVLLGCAAVALAANIAKDCGPADAYIRFTSIEIDPMPFSIVGKIKVKADVETRNVVGNQVKLSVNIRKSNLNGGFTWEVPCTDIGLVGGDSGIKGFLGTCKYKGSCDFPLLKSWITDNNCPAFFKDYDIPCACPFPAKKLSTNGFVEIDLSPFKDRLPSWLIEGGYSAEARLIDTTNNDKLVGCVQLNVQVAAEKDCPEVLRKLNAC